MKLYHSAAEARNQTQTHRDLQDLETDQASTDLAKALSPESATFLERNDIPLPVENRHGFAIHLDTSAELGHIVSVSGILPDG